MISFLLLLQLNKSSNTITSLYAKVEWLHHSSSGPFNFKSKWISKGIQKGNLTNLQVDLTATHGSPSPLLAQLQEHGPYVTCYFKMKKKKKKSNSKENQQWQKLKYSCFNYENCGKKPSCTKYLLEFYQFELL